MTIALREAIRLAEENCAKERIHTLGRVQAFGFLIALKPETQEIIQFSTNTTTFLNRTSSELLGKKVDEIFSVPQTIKSEQSFILAPRDRSSERFYCRSFLNAQNILVWELEPYSEIEDQSRWIADADRTKNIFNEISKSLDLSDLTSKLAYEIQRFTGFDRVMLYRFDSMWNGEVVAEALARTDYRIDSYAGQRFPASDIPPQARDLFLSNWIRMIPDVDAPAHSLEPGKLDYLGDQLDLKCSMLRHPSFIHLEYLKNMGVSASLTLSLIHEGKLWGLIACHHSSPKKISLFEYETCQTIAMLASSLLGVKQESEDAEYTSTLNEIHRKLVGFMTQSDDTSIGLIRYRPNLLDLAKSHGAAAAIYLEGKWAVIGKVPSIDQITGLIYWLNHEHKGKDFFATDELPSVYPPAQEFKHLASGLLAISIPKSEMSYVFWFRPEVIQTVTWAGNPEKPVVKTGEEYRIHPRVSFEKWKQEVKGRSLPWKFAEIEAALKLRKSIIETDLERQFRRERQARAETEAEKKRFSFLSQASAFLATSLKQNEVLDHLGECSVKGPAEWAVIRTLDDSENWQIAKAFHQTSTGVKVVENAYLEMISSEQLDRHFVFSKIKLGERILQSRVKNEWLNVLFSDADKQNQFIKKLGLRSYLAVPLQAKGKVIAVLEWGISEVFRYFTEKDLELAEQLALRASTAFENAKLFETAERAVQAREDVIGVVSHDLKNPLTTIGIHAQLISRSIKKGTLDVASDPAQKIIATCEKMRSLIDDLLSITKIEAGKMGVELKPYSSTKLLQEAKDLLTPIASSKSVELKISDGESTMISCEPERLSQVLSNLAGNAIKFAPVGGWVEFKTKNVGVYTEFCVADNGPGIPKEDLNQIFDRFWQARRTASQGSGLGLAIAKGIVQAHGGRIWAESKLGHGTQVYFTIPQSV